MLSGRSIGLNDNVCGQMGVMRIAGISGWTSDPPAEAYATREILSSVTALLNRERGEGSLTEYAVDPVGVDIVSPSPCTVVI